MTISEFGRRSFVTWTKGLKERIKEAEKEIQMREIKFRGLTKDGKWVYGWPVQIRDIIVIIPLEYIDDDRHCYWGLGEDNLVFELTTDVIEVIPETVGQSTGLKDKEGLEIDWWEDDLLQSLGVDKKIGQIKYDEKYAEWRLYVDGNSWCSLAAAYYDGWKKVSTIHTHPELLEQDNG